MFDRYSVASVQFPNGSIAEIPTEEVALTAAVVSCALNPSGSLFDHSMQITGIHRSQEGPNAT